MNCPQARFLLYAHLDRELTRADADALSRHLAVCGPCSARAESARGLAKVLHSRLGRAAAPARLRSKLQGVPMFPTAQRPRPSSYLFAAAVALMVFPLVADTSAPRVRAVTESVAAEASVIPVTFVSKRVTGTFVCVQCESRAEAGQLEAHEATHAPAFCADNGEIWRLMTRDPRFGENALGRTATLEGTAFPRSGFIRANRVGY